MTYALTSCNLAADRHWQRSCAAPLWREPPKNPPMFVPGSADSDFRKVFERLKRARSRQTRRIFVWCSQGDARGVVDTGEYHSWGPAILKLNRERMDYR